MHPLARDVKDTLLTRKRKLSADSDSNSLLGVLLLVIGYDTLLYSYNFNPIKNSMVMIVFRN
jgi:hypothetical protein